MAIQAKMKKAVRLLGTGLAALLFCALIIVLFVKREKRLNTLDEPLPSPDGQLSDEEEIRFTVVLDPGHGEPDGGAVGIDTGTPEAGINLNYAKALKQQLEAMGVSVVLTREDENAISADKKEDMAARKAIMNGCNADIVVSIHMNKFRDRSVSGPMAFYIKGDDAGEALAKCVLDGVCEAIDRPLRHVNPGDYFILKHSEPPAVILECGFLSNSTDEKLLQSEEHMNKMMQGAAKGIMNYLNSTNEDAADKADAEDK